ncbi:AAA family ATPase [Kitasatospora sp. NPDC127067]|uniref:AAA family ATPase n=1 Tax=Kitasatospora sp. NPDC127067 TaxID=3347126 RepID=UPI003656DC2F
MTTTTLATARSRALDPVQPGDLVALIGCAASGKSSALRTIPPHQIVSLDALRAIVSEPGDQDATADAALLQHHILLNRARRGATTYVDNTSVEAQHRLQLVELAHQHGRRAVAVLVDAPLPECLARNAARPAQQRVPEDTVRWQHRMARSARELLPREGWDEIRHLRTA